MNIKHWDQYLTPLGKTKLNVKPTTFDTLLKCDNIVLPIFQRKYCWTEKQFTRYWYDLLHIALGFGHLGHRKHKTTHDNAHTLGRIITFEEPKCNKITVIDGQQRLTTTIVILICIKHYLEKLPKKKYPLIGKINKLLFRKAVPEKIHYSEGDHLSFVRFLPTYLDRACFYDLIFDKNEYIHKESNLFIAKSFFDAELKKYGKYDQIQRVFEKLTTRFRFIYVGIPTLNDMEGTNVQHSIYQWFFEHEMYVLKGGGDRPGYTQTVCDLFRNYALSFFINESLEKQQQIYQFWICVEKSYKDVHELNDHLVCLINANEENVKKEEDKKGIRLFRPHGLVAQVEAKPSSSMKPYDIYRRFVGFIEEEMNEFDECRYKEFVYELLKCLRNKKMICVYGYLRCIKDSGNGSMFDEIAEITNAYVVIREHVSLRSICGKITKKMINGKTQI